MIAGRYCFASGSLYPARRRRCCRRPARRTFTWACTMRFGLYFRRRASAAILLMLGSTFACAQEVASPEIATTSEALPQAALADATSRGAALVGAPLPGSVSQEETTKNAATPCLEPPPLLKWQDYHGPFQKVAGAFARKLELKSVHPPRYKPGTVLCALEVKTSSPCSYGIRLIQSHFLGPPSTQVWIRPQTETPPLDEASRVMGNASVPTSPGRQHGGFSRILPIPRSSRRTLDTTA
jgi:hypothetical protein